MDREGDYKQGTYHQEVFNELLLHKLHSGAFNYFFLQLHCVLRLVGLFLRLSEPLLLDDVVQQVFFTFLLQLLFILPLKLLA
jgi:hypothetical protein